MSPLCRESGRRGQVTQGSFARLCLRPLYIRHPTFAAQKLWRKGTAGDGAYSLSVRMGLMLVFVIAVAMIAVNVHNTFERGK